jgi:hypothetical protein
MRSRVSLLTLFAASLLVACGYDPPSDDSGLADDSGGGSLDGPGPVPGIDAAGPQTTDTAMGGAGGALDVGGAGGRPDALGGGGAGGGAGGGGGATGAGGTDDAGVRDVPREVPLLDAGDAPINPTGGSGGVAGAGGAGGTGGTTARLAISSFTGSPATITVGKSSTLAWTVSGATTVSVDQGVGVVTAGSSAVVSPDRTTTYTLTARDAAGAVVTAQATVAVVPLPTITSFSAARTTITAGSSAKLTAFFSAATQASIDHGIGIVSSSVPISAGPLSADTTFTLTAVNAAGDSVTAQVVVTVVPAAVVTSFTAAPNPIALGSSTTLQPTFANGTGVIDGGIGSVTSGKAIGTGVLSANQTFTLTVTNPAGDAVTAKVTVTVVTPGSFATLAPGTLRTWHAATLLPNGKVLITGGADASGVSLKTAELFDPATGTFTATGSMLAQRLTHQATLLENGKVLITGGLLDSSPNPPSAELYDPTTGTFAATGAMVTPRSYHTATRLPDGKVLVAAGTGSAGGLDTAELYAPTAGTFTAVSSSLGGARQTPVAIWSSSAQRVLLMGDYNTQTVDSFDPSTGSFSSAGQLLTGRAYMTATLLGTAKVLVTGGFDGSATAVKSAELYDPVLQAATATGALTTTRAYHSATLLENGQVLVTGGVKSDVSNILSTAELYDPTAGTFTATGSMASPRYSHTSTALPDRRVLIVGGSDQAPGAELYFY